MKKTLNPKILFFLALILLVLVSILFFCSSYGKSLFFKSNADHEYCIKSVLENADGVKLIYGMAGVPEDKIDLAIKDAADESCKCIVIAAKGTPIQSFIDEVENESTIKRCSEESAKTIFEKYVPENIKEKAEETQQTIEQ